VQLAVYVPDRVLTPLIRALHEDNDLTAFAATREEEALGILTGAWTGGLRGVLLMQTSGFATLPNVLASLAVPYQIPLLMTPRRVQPGPGDGLPDHAAGTAVAGHRASHDHPDRRARVHPGSLDQAGDRDAGPRA